MKRWKYFLVVSPVLLIVVLNAGFDFGVKKRFTREESETFRLFARPVFEKWSGFEFNFIKGFYYTLALRVYLGKMAEKYLVKPPFVKDAIVRTTDVVTRLCPYYYDIYYIANGFLTWEFGDVERANYYLMKGIRYNPERWIYYLYLGFNHFYFLKDYEKGAYYLIEASRLSGRPFYAHLAAKLLYASGRTEVAIGVVRGMLENVKDEGWKKNLEVRLKALEAIYRIEVAVEAYREKLGKNPRDINELVGAGLLSSIPEDPYGGRFYLDEEGNVKTTSELTYKEQR